MTNAEIRAREYVMVHGLRQPGWPTLDCASIAEVRAVERAIQAAIDDDCDSGYCGT